MTKKNMPITIWFTVLTVTQSVLGISMTVLTAKKGGENKSLDQGNRSHSGRRRAPPQLLSRSQTTVTDTLRFIPAVLF